MKKALGIVCFASLILAWVPCANAYVIGCGNNKTPKCCPDNSTVGTSSIKPYTANKQRHVTDLETYGTAPIQFTRIYNSRTVDFTTNYMEFCWKQTWQHNWNYEMRDLTSSRYGFNNVKVRFPDGSDFNFMALDSSGSVRVSDAFFGSRLYPWTGGNVGHTLVTPSGWEYDFQRTTYPRYQLLQVRDGQGAAWNLTYDASDRLERIENQFGRWLQISRYTMAGGHRITSLQSSDGRGVSYDYDAWVSTTVVTTMVAATNYDMGDDGGGAQTYDPIVTTNSVTNHILANVNYPNGSKAEYTYVGAQCLANGRPLLATARDPRHPGAGARVKFLYNYDAILDFGSGPYLVTGTTLEERSLDTDETVVQLTLGSGDYPQILVGDGIELTHIYTNGLLVEMRDEEGRPTYFTRDQGGVGHLASVTDAESNTTSFVRDYAGRILQQVDPLGNTNGFTYNDSGFLLIHTDPLERTTTYTRDTNNLPTRIDYPDGSYEEWSYNEYGQPLTNRLRNGGLVTYTYYGTNETGGVVGDLKTVTDPMGHVTTHTWSDAGLPLSVTDARSNTTLFAYDWRGQLLVTTNADNTSIVYQYDAYGNRTNVVDELGRETAYTYDQYNRVQTIRDPLGRTTTLEYGRVPGCGGCGVFDPTISQITDPAGKITEYYYDLSGKRTNEVVAAGTADASATAWTYDAVGRKQTQLDANGNLHTWFYDAAGRVVAESNAMGEVTSYAYDAAGNLTNRVDGAGVETFLEYDALNRPVALGSGNLRYEYAYDLGGRRTSIFTRVEGDVVEATALDYDLNDRLVAKADPTGHVLAYAYDPVGNRIGLNVSNVLAITYAYDERNRLVEIAGNGKTTQFGYDAAGQRTNAVWPNETHAAYAFDDAGQLLALVHGRANPPGEPLALFSYAYDLSGNRTNMITLEGTNSYAYNGRNWLTFAAYPDGNAETFAYDPVGNRTSLVKSASGGPVLTTEYDYGPVNRLLASASAVETNVYVYDDAGRLVAQAVAGQSRTYAYDFMSRMTSLADTSGSVFSYAFDGEGNRIRQNLNDCLETRFIYDGPNVVMELNASNEIVRAYVNGPGMDQPIERIGFINDTPRNRQVFHADGLGSIAVLTDESGEPVQTYAYEAVGGIRAQSGTDLNRVTYTAREAIGDSLGFFYYRNRIVDPNIGRFTSEDPLGFVDGVNRYVYCGNNPVNYSDPSGLTTYLECLKKGIAMMNPWWTVPASGLFGLAQYYGSSATVGGTAAATGGSAIAGAAGLGLAAWGLGSSATVAWVCALCPEWYD